MYSTIPSSLVIVLVIIQYNAGTTYIYNELLLVKPSCFLKLCLIRKVIKMFLSFSGSLYFANVLMTDDVNAKNQIYKIDVHNEFEDITIGGSPYSLVVTDNPGKLLFIFIFHFFRYIYNIHLFKAFCRQ